MKPLYTFIEFEKAKTCDMLPCECLQCHGVFKKQKRAIVKALKGVDRHCGNFCSPICGRIHQGGLSQSVVCKNCQTEFLKKPSEILRNKNHFCSKSCAATYNNTHKTHGTRRSKLEQYLEEQLTLLYPDLLINFNKKDVINSELDIYIPSLKLAFELNGIYHYKPIHGDNKLEKIRINDTLKKEACKKLNIELNVINTSTKEHETIFLKIIADIINYNLV